MALWNAPAVVPQVFRVNSTKDIFNLESPFRPGSGSLKVFLNGLLAVVGEDYDEINRFTIKWRTPCEAGDVVITLISNMG